MPGIKPLPLTEFHRSLRAEGTTICALARRARVGRAHLTQVLAGTRSGAHTWKHILPLLTPNQLFHLKQCSAWNTTAQAEYETIQNLQTPAA